MVLGQTRHPAALLLLLAIGGALGIEYDCSYRFKDITEDILSTGEGIQLLKSLNNKTLTMWGMTQDPWYNHHEEKDAGSYRCRNLTLDYDNKKWTITYKPMATNKTVTAKGTFDLVTNDQDSGTYFAMNQTEGDIIYLMGIGYKEETHKLSVTYLSETEIVFKSCRGYFGKYCEPEYVYSTEDLKDVSDKCFYDTLCNTIHGGCYYDYDEWVINAKKLDPLC